MRLAALQRQVWLLREYTAAMDLPLDSIDAHQTSKVPIVKLNAEEQALARGEAGEAAGDWRDP